MGKDACQVCVCVWLSWCWGCYSVLLAGKDKCSPQPHSSHHADSQWRELSFSLVWNAVLSWDIRSFTIFVTWIWLNRSSPLLSPHCALWECFLPCDLFICPLTPATRAGPSSFHLCLSDLKVWLQESLGRFLWPCCSWHLSGYHNILRVLYHVEGAPVEVWGSVKISLCPGDSLQIPRAEQQGLWTTAHCPVHFIEMFHLVGFQFLTTPDTVLGSKTSPLIFKGCYCLGSHLSGQPSLNSLTGSGLSSRYRILAWNSPRAGTETVPPAVLWEAGQRLTPRVRLLLAGGLHWACRCLEVRCTLSHSPLCTRDCVFSPWSHMKWLGSHKRKG